MSPFIKNSLAIFVNFSFTVNQLFSQAQTTAPTATDWVKYATGPKGEPGWWAGRGATNTAPINDEAVVKQGQLKHFTLKAIQELDARYPGALGGAGPDLRKLLNGDGTATNLGWLAARGTAGQAARDEENITVGQLKYVANLVHKRLKALGAAQRMPQWLTVNANNDELANIGQLKTVFNFTTVPIENLDKDSDGIPDKWELANGLDPAVNDANKLVTPGGKSFIDTYRDSLLALAGDGLATIPALTIGSEAPHQAVGAIKGTLSVGGDGSSSYSIPIDIPKGTAGMEPSSASVIPVMLGTALWASVGISAASSASRVDRPLSRRMASTIQWTLMEA